MGKDSAGKQRVREYMASVHYGICHGPLDYIAQIIVNEKEAWAGQQETQGAIEIDQKKLFGGVKKEGGVQGLAEYLPGGPTQTIPEVLASKVGRTTATMPAYRGIASVWFHNRHAVTGQHPDTGVGFYWSANNPYLPGVWIKVARASTALNEEHARIYRSASQEPTRRTIANTGSSASTFGHRFFDMSEGRIVRASNDLSELIIEDVLTGDEIATIPISYEPRWMFICADRSEIIVMGETDLYVYDWSAGTTKQTVGGLPDMGAAAALSGPASKDIVVGGNRYLFFKNYRSIIILVASGAGSWSVLSSTTVSGITEYGGQVAASADYVVNIRGDVIWRWDWDPDTGALSNKTTVSHGLTGSDINSVLWLSESDVWVFVVDGRVLTLNGDLTSTVNDMVTGPFAQTNYLMSWRGATDDASRITGTGGSFVAPDWGYVSTVDVLTGTLVQQTALADWGFAGDPSVASYLDAGWDETSNAWALHNGAGTAWVLIGGSDDEFDSNPAHIIYECLTNTSWGMGAPAGAIDVDSFEAAAETLYDEDFGLSMIWTRQTTIEAFVTEVIDHIEATLFVSPRTGLLTLKLIRDDYSITGLPEFTPDNSVVTKFSRKLWGETINEIVVTWTNPENEEEETVVAQDNANISTQGGIVTDSRNYYGVRVKDLAMRLAQRDLRAASTPLASCDIEVNREGWDLLPGDVCILNSPDDGIESIVMRVGPVEYGRPGDATVKASMVEDVWALSLAEYTVPPDTLAEDSGEDPTAADFTLILTLPYFEVANRIDPAIAAVEHPEVFSGVLAAEDGPDTLEFDLYGEVTDAGGNTSVEELATLTIASRATLAEALAAEAETVVPATDFAGRTRGNGPSVGSFVLFEGADETEHELCLVTASGGSPLSYTLSRGVLDTVPREWDAGTPVWFVDASLAFVDQTVRSAAETVDYQLTPRTSRGTLDLDDAPIVSETLTARPHLPSRPANVTVNGDDGFSGALDLTAVDPIPVTWARRNRLTEDSIVLAWDAADVTPEDGQTTTVRLTDTAGATLHEYTAIAGTTQDVDPADFGDESEGFIEVWAVRDGLESLQAHRVRVLVSGAPFEFEDGEPYEYEDEAIKAFED